VVEFFELAGHPKAAKRAYAESHLDGYQDEKNTVYSGLGDSPREIAKDAVKASIAADAKASEA